ncbi:MAG: trypsin-like peptidase domain-containing protein [Ilumatobacteraceae bacterium]
MNTLTGPRTSHDFDPPAQRPPTLPPEAPRPASPPARPPRGPGRFLAGVAIGAAVGALVAGGIVAVSDHDGGGGSLDPSAAVGPATGDASAAAAPTNPIDALVRGAEPAIVSIHDSIAQTDEFGREVEGQAAGTGFVLSADGYLVTNDHVVDGASDITARFSDGTSLAATVVAADPGSDLAVLQVDRTGLSALPLGDSSALHVGDQVVAIGNALDLSGSPTVTTGIVSATGRSLTEPNGTHLTGLLQTDTAINPGNSGGPLLDMHGQVIGIDTAIAGQAQNIGFAIAIDPARTLIDQLRNGQVPDHALLGVSTRPVTAGAGSAAADGAQVVRVTAGSPAAAAGVEAGDVVTAVDGRNITSPDDLGAAIAAHQPGDEVKITYERSGASHTTAVTLGTRPAGGD